MKNNAINIYQTIKNTITDNVADLDIVMPMYNPLEYGDKYSKTSGSLWNYYGDQVNDVSNKNNGNNYRIKNNKLNVSKSFEYKKIGTTLAANNALETEVVVLLNYLSSFWRSFDLSLIYWWSIKGIISEICRTP